MARKGEQSKAMSVGGISTDRRLLGEAIRLRRKSLQMTQQKLAEMISKSTPTVSKIEAGLHPLDIDTLAHVAKGLKTSPTRLVWDAQRKRLSKEPGLTRIVPVLDSLLDSLEKNGVEL